jgi:DNA-binding transcriptional MerR regulator
MDEKMLQSGELARLAGVSTDLLRHYERLGIVPPPHRTSNGYRQYPSSTVGRIRIVRRSLSLGFSLPELARIFAVRDRGGAPCRSVRALAEEKLRQVEQSLMELKTLRRELQKTLLDWDRRLARTPAGRRAELLRSLGETSVAGKPGKYKVKKGRSRT